MIPYADNSITFDLIHLTFIALDQLFILGAVSQIHRIDDIQRSRVNKMDIQSIVRQNHQVGGKW